MSAQKSILSILLFVCSVPFLQAQGKVYLPFFEALNMDASYQYSVTKLYKMYLENTGRYEVILSEKRDTIARPEPLKQARESAEAMNASYFVMGEMNRVGEVVVVVLSMYTTSEGKKVWSQMLKAGSPDDLDPIMQKMAEVTGTNQKIEKEDGIYNVTNYAAQGVNTKKTVNNFGVTIGGAYPFFSSSSIDEEVAGGFGLMWSFDAGNLIFDIKGEGYFNKVNSIYFLDIDVNYPFLAKPNTPFAMAGLGWGGITADYKGRYQDNNDVNFSPYETVESRSGGGLMGFVGGGYIINRTSNVRLRLSARGFYAFYNLDGWYNSDADKTQPFGGIVSVAVLFKR